MKQTSSNQLKSDVTITEKSWNRKNNKVTLIKPLKLQDFVTINPYLFNSNENGFAKFDYHESEEEWQCNNKNGELTITEINSMNPSSNMADRIPNVTFTEMKIKECCIGDCFGYCGKICTGGELKFCKVCNHYKTQHARLMRMHMLSHPDIKKYACDVCDYTTRKSYSLKSHKRTHTGEKPYVCDVCQFACNDGSTLKRHKYLHSGQKPFACTKCDYKCTRNTHLQRHIRTHNPDNSLACDTCDFVCDAKTTFASHKQEHIVSKPLVCTLCSYATNDKSSLRRHKLTHSQLKPHSCDRCEYKCRRISHLRRHMLTHERKSTNLTGFKINPLICEECGYFAKDAYDSEIHPCNVDSDRIYYCNRCYFHANKMEDYKSHKIAHLNEKYSCHLCSYTTQTYDSLRKHWANHTKRKKYFCNDCGYSTDHYSSMKKHKLNHSSNYEFKCNTCSYTSKRELNLERHKEIHKRDKTEDPNVPMSVNDFFHDDRIELFGLCKLEAYDVDPGMNVAESNAMFYNEEAAKRRELSLSAGQSLHNFKSSIMENCTLSLANSLIELQNNNNQDISIGKMNYFAENVDVHNINSSVA